MDRREVHDVKLGPVDHHQPDRVARPHAEAVQAARDALDVGAKLRVGQLGRAVRRPHRDRIPARLRRDLERLAQRLRVERSRPRGPGLLLRGGHGRTLRQGPPSANDQVMIGMIRIATMLATLIMGLIAGPAVSLNGSPTVSPVTDAAWASEPLPPNAPSSISFFALSHAPPPAVMRTAKKNPTTITPMSRPPRARSSIRQTIRVMAIGSSDGRIISRCAARVTSATAV